MSRVLVIRRRAVWIAASIAMTLLPAAAAAQSTIPWKSFSLEDALAIERGLSRLPLLEERASEAGTESKKREEIEAAFKRVIQLKDMEVVGIYRVALAYCHLYAVEQKAHHLDKRNDAAEKWGATGASVGFFTGNPYATLIGLLGGAVAGVWSVGKAPEPPDCAMLKTLMEDVGKIGVTTTTPTQAPPRPAGASPAPPARPES